MAKSAALSGAMIWSLVGARIFTVGSGAAGSGLAIPCVNVTGGAGGGAADDAAGGAGAGARGGGGGGGAGGAAGGGRGGRGRRRGQVVVRAAAGDGARRPRDRDREEHGSQRQTEPKSFLHVVHGARESSLPGVRASGSMSKA